MVPYEILIGQTVRPNKDSMISQTGSKKNAQKYMDISQENINPNLNLLTEPFLSRHKQRAN